MSSLRLPGRLQELLVVCVLRENCCFLLVSTLLDSASRDLDALLAWPRLVDQVERIRKLQDLVAQLVVLLLALRP